MKTLLVFVLVGFVALVIALAVRKQRSEVLRRQFPGPNLRRRTDLSRDESARQASNDSSFITTASITGSDVHHGSHHADSADCAPSHDAGASCGSDGGGGGADGGST